jgi:hypothetical protein
MNKCSNPSSADATQAAALACPPCCAAASAACLARILRSTESTSSTRRREPRKTLALFDGQREIILAKGVVQDPLFHSPNPQYLANGGWAAFIDPDNGQVMRRAPDGSIEQVTSGATNPKVLRAMNEAGELLIVDADIADANAAYLAVPGQGVPRA